ncbi:MAG: GTP 3',8-cyclase MoaA [Deltaproteobacteria bacterium]|nr:GTP 3',8-cyclase MoaA [Deltaproteobacteria bacterium]
MSDAVPTSAPRASEIVDRFGRSFNYLRLSLIERCNLRCVYCMPEEGMNFKEAPELLTTAEIDRLIRMAASFGVDKVRLTGGEPLLRRDIIEIVHNAATTEGIAGVALTTNGVLLERLAGSLCDAGLSAINISLDTLKAERFAQITRRLRLEDVKRGIDAALSASFAQIKLNVVAMRGFNDDEIVDFVRLADDKRLTVRFIELMPFDADQIWKRGRFFGAERIKQVLLQHFSDLESDSGSSTEAHVFRRRGAKGKLAIIPAYTRDICRDCNRIRITADGKIRNCLFSNQEFDLRDAMRAGADDAALGKILCQAMLEKPVDGWAAQRQDDVSATDPRTSMTQIGG